jgi:exodeoxyribonuclease V gamma subunit
LHGLGQLPLAAFGQRSGQALIDIAEQVRARRAPWLAKYTVLLEAHPVDLSFEGGISLTGALDGFYGLTTHPASACLQLAERTGAVLQGKKDSLSARGHVLVTLWVRHLAACASGLRLTSVQLGVDGQVVLHPLVPQVAHDVLANFLKVLAQAWLTPLAVAPKTAWAYLQAQRVNAQLPPDKPPKDPHDAAQLVFEGGQFDGEWDQSAYLQRAFASYADLRDALPALAQALYGDLAAQVDVTQTAPEVSP